MALRRQGQGLSIRIVGTGPTEDGDAFPPNRTNKAHKEGPQGMARRPNSHRRTRPTKVRSALLWVEDQPRAWCSCFMSRMSKAMWDPWVSPWSMKFVRLASWNDTRVSASPSSSETGCAAACVAAGDLWDGCSALPNTRSPWAAGRQHWDHQIFPTEYCQPLPSESRSDRNIPETLLTRVHLENVAFINTPEQ